MKILVAYASAHGSTAEVAAFIGRQLQTYSVEVDCAPVESINNIQMYDAVIVGSPIHDGMWLQSMSLFLERLAAQLATKPVYLFITCIRVLEEGGYHHALNNYLHVLTLKKINVRDTTAFAGKLKLDTIDWNERWLLTLRYDGSELPQHLNVDYRDWYTIASWANKVALNLKLKPTFAVAST
jgi:menaquinone-dependent protoporphyrinogen oxidase